MLQGERLTEFQEHYWRKQPCVFRNAIDYSAYPIAVNDVCQLTFSNLVESRMINANHELFLGPFENAGDPGAFIPENHLLLVQCLEQHLNAAQSLLRDQFHFVPAWQVDDVMASVGYTGANCGAHFDQYDVFLLQHKGKKRWQLDDGGHIESDLDDNQEVRLLRRFRATQTYDLAPGDVLYLPPGIGHFGICDGLSMTLSIGIRNPTPAELLADLSEFMIEGLAENNPMNNQLYGSDKGLPAAVADELFGEISRLFSPTTLQQWYGCYVTRLREPELLCPDEAREYTNGMSLSAALPCRMSYARIGQMFYFFVNGDAVQLADDDEGWVVTLCSARKLQKGYIASSEGMHCLQSLLYAGAVF
ncbi:cupin domain-containing protein [Gammaproteobacteria bacterium]|nr:cupin domain-containing protein [Gammaproteobacteria bacterium]